MSSSTYSKSIPNFPGYTVSSEGRVFNKDGRELGQTVNRDGYSMVKLCNNGYEKNCSVHRLVAESYIPNHNNKRTVNHIDGNKLNNTVSNLEWCTHSENLSHAYEHNLRKSYLTNDDRKNGAIISAEKRRRKVRVIETGIIYDSVIQCARETGCYTGAIANCCNGTASHHHGYHFEWV